MKTVFDETLSKNPIKMVEDADVAVLEQNLVRLNNEIAELDKDLEAYRDPRYMRIVIQSHERIKELAMKNAFIPVNNVLAHAEIVGQINERIRLTRELKRIKSDRDKKWNLFTRISQKVTELKAKLKGQGK